jgi:hypothetical protein
MGAGRSVAGKFRRGEDERLGKNRAGFRGFDQIERAIIFSKITSPRRFARDLLLWAICGDAALKISTTPPKTRRREMAAAARLYLVFI